MTVTTPPDPDPAPARSLLAVLLRRVVHVRDEEINVTLWSAGYLFFVLCSYYVLRPLRDEISTADPENLQFLWTGTFFAMLAVVPVYAWIASRFPRRVFIPFVYRFFILNLLAFVAVMLLTPVSIRYLVERAGAIWLIGSDEVILLALERVFYVWLSVFSLFVVTVFWQFMADVFRNEQGRRLFGFIAVGGSIGAVGGSAITGALVTSIGMASLMLVAAVLLEGAVQCMRRIHRMNAEPNVQAATAWPARDREMPPTDADAPVSGSVWEGMLVVFRSPFLLGICLFLFLHTFCASFLYYHQAFILREALEDRDERRALLANVDLVVNALAAFGQCFVTGRIVRWFGVGVTLTVLPIISVLGFVALGVALLLWANPGGTGTTAPVLAGYSLLVWVLVVFQVMRRAGNFAFAKPAREILFTVVPRAQKYKSKAFVDTAIYRGGDLVSGYLFAGLKWTGLGLAGLALLAAPVAAAWSVVGIRLGRRQDQLAAVESRPCPRCGNDLRGSSGRCPECGRIDVADVPA
ncbi:MAG: NTP/NDP exchange transporter [Planctomycetota bacterium]|jgi:AAA family ATP:ADP antiporter